MKYISKRPFFAAVVLRALLLILPVSALAAAADGQEIGTPTPFRTEVKSCFDVHLSPSSDRFYTLYEGTLRLYQVNPFKMLSATQGEWGAIKELGCQMRITDDEKKLLVVDKNRIYAFDIGSGRLLNKAEWEHRPYPAVSIINNDELLILHRDASGGHQEGNLRTWVDLYIWDIGTLKLKRKINDFGENFGFIQDAGGGPAMTKIQDKIYLKSDLSVVVLNSKTYKPELSLDTGIAGSYGGIRYQKQLSSRELPLLSKDFRTLYVPRIVKMTDYLTGKQSSFDEIGRDKAFVFDQKTREFRIDSLEKLSRDKLDPALFGNLSRNKNYLMHKGGNGAVLRSIGTNSPALFSQYTAGEAIVVEYSSDNLLMSFQLTPGARKYLMMDKDARIPINDATFAKYYRPQARNTP